MSFWKALKMFLECFLLKFQSMLKEKHACCLILRGFVYIIVYISLSISIFKFTFY